MDFNIGFKPENFIKVYKDVYDPEFDDYPYPLYISSKSEFALPYDPEEQIGDRGVFFNHQKLNQRLMHAIDNIIIMDEAGTGKTGSVAATTEEFLEDKEDINKAIILLPNDTLINDFQDKIVNIHTTGKYDPKFTRLEQAQIEAGVDPASILTETKIRIRRGKNLKKNGYVFTTPTIFVKKIMKNKKFHDPEYLKKIYSNSIFVIDEVHNLRMEQNMTVEKKLKTNYKQKIKKDHKKLLEEDPTIPELTKEDLIYKPRDIVDYYKEFEPNEYTRIVAKIRKRSRTSASEENLNKWIRETLKSNYRKFEGRKYKQEDIIDYYENKRRTNLTDPEIYMHLWRIFHTVDNAKIMLLSATPMVSKPSEIYHYLNLLLPTSLQFDTSIVRETAKRYNIDIETYKPPFNIDTIHTENIEDVSDYLEPFLRGKISFVSAITAFKDVNIYYLPNDTYAKYYKPNRYNLRIYESLEFINYDIEIYSELNKYYNYSSSNLDLTKIRLFYEEMSEFQSDIYINTYFSRKGTGREGQAARQLEINVSNFVFPDKSYGRRGYNKYIHIPTKTEMIEGKEVRKDIKDVYEFKDNIDVRNEVSDNEIESLGINLHDDIYDSILITTGNERIMLILVYYTMIKLNIDYNITLFSQVIDSDALDSLKGWLPSMEVFAKAKRTDVRVDRIQNSILTSSINDLGIVVDDEGISFSDIWIHENDIQEYKGTWESAIEGNNTASLFNDLWYKRILSMNVEELTDGILIHDIFISREKVSRYNGILENIKQDSFLKTLFISSGSKFNILYYSYKELFEDLHIETYRDEYVMSIKNRVKNLYFLRKLSVKYYDIVKAAKENWKRRPEERRKMFIYEHLIKGSNMIILLLCLEQHGITRYEPGSINVTTSEGKILDLKEKDKGYRVALFKGTESSNVDRENIKHLFNHPMNVYGEYMSIVIVSEVGQAGISLLGVQDIHIINPQWNPSETYQAIFRGIRRDSFDALIKMRKLAETLLKKLPSIDVNIRIHCAIPNLKSVERSNMAGRKFSIEDCVDYSAYKAASNKALHIDRVGKILKGNAITCLIHEERNKNKENDIICHPCRKFDCEYIKSIKGTDESTYSFYDIEDKQQLIDNVISNYFKQYNEGELDDIYRHYLDFYMLKETPLKRKYFTYILSKSINEEKIYSDKFGFKSFLMEDRGIYYLNRDYSNINERYQSYYNNLLITTQYNTLQSYVSKLNEEEYSSSFNLIWRMSYENIVGRFKSIITFDLMEMGFFLERIIIMYIFENIDDDVRYKISRFFDLFFPSLLITVEPTVYIENPPIRNPTKEKRHKTAIRRTFEVDKIKNYDEKRKGAPKDVFRTPGHGEKVAFVHNLYIMNVRRETNITSNVFKSQGLLRVLDLEKGQWRDASYAEYLIYNVGFQYRNIDFKEYLSNYTNSTYLYPINNKYRIASLIAENGRSEYTGRDIVNTPFKRVIKEFNSIIEDDTFPPDVRRDLEKFTTSPYGGLTKEKLKDKLLSVLRENNAVVYYTGFVADYELQEDYPGLQRYRQFIEDYRYVESDEDYYYEIPLIKDRNIDIDIALMARTSFMTPMGRIKGRGSRAYTSVPRLLEDYVDISSILSIPRDF